MPMQHWHKLRVIWWQSVFWTDQPEMGLEFREPLLEFGDQRVLGHPSGPDTGAEGVVYSVAIVVGDLHAAV